MTFFGPFVTVELKRLARRGHHLRLRFYLCLALLFALFVLYDRTFPDIGWFGDGTHVDRNQHGVFAESFMIVVLTAQFAALLVLAPVYTGGSLCEEAEARTLEFLLASPLEEPSIIFGKFVARMIYVFAAALTALPVLALAMFFGGIDAERLAAGTAIAMVGGLHLGAAGMACASYQGRLSGTLAATFGILIAEVAASFFAVELSAPTAFYAVLKGKPGLLGIVLGFSVYQLLTAFFFLIVASVRLRSDALTGAGEAEAPDPAPAPPPVKPVRVPEEPEPEPFWTPEVRFETPRAVEIPPIPDDGDPLVWKDANFQAVHRTSFYRMASIMGIVGGTMFSGIFLVWMVVNVLAVLLSRDLVIAKDKLNAVRTVLLLAVGIGGVAGSLALGVRMASSVAVERQRQTLLSLLTIPWSRREILRSMAKAALRSARWWLGLAGVGLVLSVPMAWALSVLSMPFLLAAHLSGFLAFCLALAAAATAEFRTQARAVVAFLSVWILIVAIAPLTMNGTAGVRWLSPPAVLAEIGESRLNGAGRGIPMITVAVVALGYWLAAAVLWRFACRRFEAEEV